MCKLRIEVPAEELADLCRRHHVRNLAVFGSTVRGDDRPDSDIDLLVEFQPEARVGFLALGRLQRELSALLGRPVEPGAPGRAQASQIMAAEIDQQRHHVGLKMPILRTGPKRLVERAPELAQRVVALYNRLQHGPSGPRREGRERAGACKVRVRMWCSRKGPLHVISGSPNRAQLFSECRGNVQSRDRNTHLTFWLRLGHNLDE